jgi:lipopolysaccharide biosynthesis glycosyltransferase
MYERTLVHPYIVHFTDYLKPWVLCFHPYRRAFYGYVDRTAWLGWRCPWWKSAIAFCQRILDYLHSKMRRLLSLSRSMLPV